MEQLIAFAALFWIGFADNMLNPKNSRPKRVFFFFLFYIPIAAVLIWAAYATYSRIGVLFSLLLYALMVFLLFFLGEKAWFASRAKEKAAFEKMRIHGMILWVKYKNRLMSRKNKLYVRIFFFIILFLPFYVIPGLLMLIMRSVVPLVLPLMYVTAFLTLIAAIVVFFGKNSKKN
jgi:hypothetical protein